jgi:DNA-binding Xre family transcriptional regulator
VRWRVGDLLKERKLTAYWLVQKSKLPTTTFYRVAKARGQVKRIDGQTLEALCAAFGVGPGELSYGRPGLAGGNLAEGWRS